MAQDLEKLVVSLEANLKQYERELARAQKTTVTQLRKIEGDAAKSMGRVEKSFASAGSALAGFGKGLVIGGIFAAVAGVEQLVAGSISSAAAIGDLSDKLGITSAKLQEIQYGAVQANLGFDEMETGLLKFSKALGQAQNGSGDLLKTLEANGFTQAQIKALSYSEALDVVADLIANARNEQDALLITLQAFGKGGDGFLELLRGGSSGLKGIADDATNAEAVIHEDLIKSAQAFDDAWSAALLNIKAGIGNMVLGAVPYIQAFDKMVSDAADNLGLMLGTLTPAQISGGKPATPLTPGNSTGKGSIANSGGTKVFDPTAAAAAKKASDEAAASYAAQQKAISGVIESLKFEGEQLNRSELAQRIANEQRKAGVAATSEQGKAIAELVTRNFELEQSQQGAIDAGEKFLEAQEEMRDAFMNLAEIGVDALDAIVVGGEKASDVMKGLVKQLASAAIKALLLGQGPLAGLFGGGGGLIGNLFGGARASGGPVSAGKAYMVGEKGRELFVPSQSGTIIPNGKGGGQNIVFAPRIDARGADVGAVARLTSELRIMQRDFTKNVRNAVSGEKSLNPRFAR